MEKVKPDALLILGDTYSGLSVHAGGATRHQDVPHGGGAARVGQAHARAAQPHSDRPHEQHPAAVQPLSPREPDPREHPSLEDHSSPATPTFEAMRASCRRSRPATSSSGSSSSRRDTFWSPRTAARTSTTRCISARMFEALGEMARRFKREVIYPMHPRTKSKIEGHRDPEGRRGSWRRSASTISTSCSRNCFCVLSDSGTAPEEALFYKVPCVSLRMTTERPETVEGGATSCRAWRWTTSSRRSNGQPAVGRALRSRGELRPLVGRDQCIRSQITNFF